MGKWFGAAAAVLLGLVTGWLLRPASERSSWENVRKSARATQPASPDLAPSYPPLPEPKPPWKLRSTVALADLDQIDPTPLRLAHAVVALQSASAEEISAYWHKHRPTNQDERLLDRLLLRRWLELNPTAALAAAAGRKDERVAWQCYGVVDPHAALRLATGLRSRFVQDILLGCAQSDPRLALQLVEQYPHYQEQVQWTARNSLSGLDWQESLEFIFHHHALHEWAKHDLLAALNWAQQRPHQLTRDLEWKGLVEPLIDKHPTASSPFQLTSSPPSITPTRSRTATID